MTSPLLFQLFCIVVADAVVIIAATLQAETVGPCAGRAVRPTLGIRFLEVVKILHYLVVIHVKIQFVERRASCRLLQQLLCLIIVVLRRCIGGI